MLSAAATLAANGRGRFLAPLPLQSWPGIVHGGGLVACLDAAAAGLGRPSGLRRVDGRLTSSIPTETALALEGHADGERITVTVLQDGVPLSMAAVAPVTGAGRGSAAWAGGDEGWRLPMSEHCLACGSVNPLGLQVALRFDDEGVWAALTPREPWRTAGGALQPALAPVVLDEVAWWLGALMMKEGGLTNRITVGLLRPDVPAGRLVAAGRYAEVTPVDRKRSFWRTETALVTEAGEIVATASIVFRGGAEYSGRQMAYFRPRTPPDVFRRMFPNHVR